MKTFVLCLKNHKYLLFNILNQYTRYTNNQADSQLAYRRRTSNVDSE